MDNTFGLCRQSGRIVVAMAILGMALSAGAQGHVRGRVLVKFRPQVSDATARSVINSLRGTQQAVLHGLGVRVVSLPNGTSESAVASALARRADVEFAELDQLRMPGNLIPNDPRYTYAWHLPRLECPAAWALTTGSPGVIIAVLDTGCDPLHSDLAGKYVSGWNFYDNNSDSSDVYGHGTSVAGVAGAATNNGNGVASIAWGSKIMPIRISAPDGSGSFSAMANGLTWAADRGARVANISYSVSDSATVRSAAQYFLNRGGVVTVSAGNNGAVSSSPDNPYVLTVSATDQNDLIASWSNRGSNIDLAAPGVNIYTTSRGGSYGAGVGTSFSAPVVAGIAALVISANPGLTGAQVQDILKQSANDLGTAGWDSLYGWGRVNAYRAVNMALGGSTLDLIPPNVAFGSPNNGATVSGSITVQVNASDNVGVASVSLRVNGSTLATRTATPYNFAWNTATVPNGSHTLEAIAADAAGNTAISQIAVEVGNFADVTPPTVRITSPASGARFTTSLAVAATATDDVRVTKVELWVNNRLQASKTSAPYNFSINTRKWAAGSYTLVCKGYDPSGNVGVSTSVGVAK